MPTESLQAVLALPANHGLAVEIAARVRAAILTGHFGPGERLREEALATAMGVSRGPVREALAKLEREGLIVIQRNRGAFVARLSTEDLEEVYTLRVAIERLAVRRAAELATGDELVRLQAVVDAMAEGIEREISEQGAAELDLRFHDIVYQAARHRRLYECWTNLRPQIHIVLLSRNAAHPDFRMHSVSVSSHQVIVDALRERDTARTVELTEEHLRGSYERTMYGYGLLAEDPIAEPRTIAGRGAR